MEHSTNDVSGVVLRVATQEDEEFLYSVYLSTRREEMAAWGWAEAQQQMFARMQFNVRRQAYRMQFPTLEEKIILFKDEPAGTLLVERTERAIRLVDIALLPEYRNHGIGKTVIEGLFAEADAQGKSVQLQVLRENEAARRLYERMGFTLTNESEMYFSMERRSAHASPEKL